MQKITTDDRQLRLRRDYCPISFNSARDGTGDRLAEIWTSAVLRVDRGHLPDLCQSKSSAACASNNCINLQHFSHSRTIHLISDKKAHVDEAKASLQTYLGGMADILEDSRRLLVALTIEIQSLCWE